MNPPPLRSTALRIKTHTGCQQCKRRKIKCDETKPICRRCQARGDHCSQPARPEQWQTVVLRPVAQPSTHLSDDDLLQYFAAVMLKDMVVDVKTAAPLRQALDPLIQRSKALLYSVRSLTQIHRNRFDPASMHAPLQDRQRAVVALRQEVQQELVDALQSRSALNRLLLASLFLTILHAWCDAPHENGALLHLRGATATVDLLLAPQYRDPRTVVLQDFLVGTVAFLDMMYAFLIPASNPLPQSSRMLDMLKQDRWRSGTYIHPVSGLATPLIMLVAQTGRYYRSVVDLRIRDPRREHELERSLLAWQPLDADDKTLYVRVADAYRLGVHLLRIA
ncbi:putative c6 transcription factor protein [Neofusicoccum parvum UCRNP2]|uniref:Putative c6 transcription factor protein n=1 Tax=Botryosphaeria parva (strain UCR-NP2) TaxID=1287680 RepID=R1EPL5_BOTPV|nr:putative c6 transcription factor protein [Neofusicoccum parvum UCRNP2]